MEGPYPGPEHRYHHGHEYPYDEQDPEHFYPPPPHHRRPMHDYDIDSHDEYRQHDEFDRFSRHELPRPYDDYPSHYDFRRQPHDTYPRPHDYPQRFSRPHDDEYERYHHDRYPPSHSGDRMHDNAFDDDLRANEDDTNARKQANKVELPDTQSVDLANVKFPRRGEFALPDGPALDAVRLNSRDEAASPGSRSGVPFPQHDVDAHLTTRDGAPASDAAPVVARSSLPETQGWVSRIKRGSSDGFELPASQMDIAKVGTLRRDGLALADAGKGAVQDVL